MPAFSISAYDVETGAVVDTFKSLLGLKAADTVGHRARIRSLTAGGAGAAAQDIQVALRLVRSNNTTDGTATAVTPEKLDPDSVAANLSGKKDYSAEPTVVASVPVWEGSINARGTLVKEWLPGEGPVVDRDSTMLLQGAPGITTAVPLSVAMEFEEF